VPVIIDLPKISGKPFYKACKMNQKKRNEKKTPKITEAAQEDPQRPEFFFLCL
jgi:hypothetical protein